MEANVSLIGAYEEQVRKLHERRTVLHEKPAGRAKKMISFNEAYRTAHPFRVLRAIQDGKSGMVEPNTQTSNQLLERLSEWNEALEATLPTSLR